MRVQFSALSVRAAIAAAAAAFAVAGCAGGSSTVVPTTAPVPQSAPVDSPTSIAPLKKSQVTPASVALLAPKSVVAGQNFVPQSQPVSTNLYYSYGGESGMVAAQMAASATSPRGNVSVTSPPVPFIDSWGWIAAQSENLTSWPAQRYTVSLNITRPNASLRIVGVKFYRVNSENGGTLYQGVALVGMVSGLSIPLSTVGVKTVSVNGIAISGASTDKLAVKFYVASVSPYAQSFEYDSGSGALSGVTAGTTSPPPPTPTPAPTAAPTAAPTTAPTSAPTAAPTASPAFAHVTVVIMENYGYSDIVNNSSAPFLNALASRTAFFVNSHGVTHPSEPNYLALFSGSTQGVTSDYCPLTFSGANIATQLAAAGRSFAGYAENMPSSLSACGGSPSPYASGYYYMRKHVPWADFTNVPAGDYYNWSGPGTSLTGSVNFITPNMCDDMHDCGIAAGDRWLSENVPAIESWDNSNNGLLILTFDEDDYGSSSNQIYTVFDGPGINPGHYTQWINHYNVLRFMEDNFHLSHLGGAASALPISGVLQ